MHRLVTALVTTLMLVPASDLHAQCSTSTCTSDGAVEKPANWDISLPFEEGENVRVLSGYGPQMGSGLHCRSTDTSCANDWYALDLILPDYANSGLGQPVVAIASGTVISAEFGSAGWANYGRRVYIRHDFNGDGHTYTSMYAHLDSITVNQGDTVGKGDQIGTLGGSCQGQDSCDSFSTPHVHFSIHQDSNFGGSGSGGSYGGKAVRPEPIDGYTSLSQGDDLVSQNGDPEPPPPECDVMIDSSQEWVIEEDGNCGQVVGSLSDNAAGSGDHSYTGTLANPSPDYANGLIYHLEFAEAGEYEVWANIPAGVADSPEATYKIQYAGEESTNLVVDQAAAGGTEIRLGRFSFDTDSSQWIRIGDNYDDQANDGKTFVMDAVRVFSAADCVCDEVGAATYETCDVAGQKEFRCDGCQLDMVADCPPIDIVDENNGTGNNTAGNNATGNNSTGNNDTTEDGGAGSDGPGVITAEGGCGCSSTDASSGGLLALLGLFALGLARMRSRD